MVFMLRHTGHAQCISKIPSVRPAAQQHVQAGDQLPVSKYATPQLRTKFGERAYSHAGPAAWNSLPPDIRAAASPVVFKKLLKMHFLT